MNCQIGLNLVSEKTSTTYLKNTWWSCLQLHSVLMCPLLASSLLMDNHGECSVSIIVQYYSSVGYHRLYIRAASSNCTVLPFVNFGSNILPFQQVLCTVLIAAAIIGNAPIEGCENVVLRLATLVSLYVDYGIKSVKQCLQYLGKRLFDS